MALALVDSRRFAARKISEILAVFWNTTEPRKWTLGMRTNAIKLMAPMEQYFHHFMKKKKDTPYLFHKCVDQCTLNTNIHQNTLASKQTDFQSVLMSINMVQPIVIAVIMSNVHQKVCLICTLAMALRSQSQHHIFTKVLFHYLFWTKLNLANFDLNIVTVAILIFDS